MQLFSQQPERPKLEHGDLAFESGTLDICAKAGTEQPIYGSIKHPTTGEILFTAYGLDWFTVSGHLQQWLKAWERGEIRL